MERRRYNRFYAGIVNTVLMLIVFWALVGLCIALITGLPEIVTWVTR